MTRLQVAHQPTDQLPIMNDMKLFSGRAHPTLAKRIGEYLGLPLGSLMIGSFPDTEISCKIEEDVRGLTSS